MALVNIFHIRLFHILSQSLMTQYYVNSFFTSGHKTLNSVLIKCLNSNLCYISLFTREM